MLVKDDIFIRSAFQQMVNRVIANANDNFYIVRPVAESKVLVDSTNPFSVALHQASVYESINADSLAAKLQMLSMAGPSGLLALSQSLLFPPRPPDLTSSLQQAYLSP